MIKDIIAGDTYKVEFKTDNFQSPDATCTFLLQGPTALQIQGTADGEGGWNFVVSSMQTSLLTAGTYTYAFRVTQDGESYTKKHGPVTVKANPADTTPKVMFAEKMVAAIERVLEGQLSAKEVVAISSMSVGGRSLTLLDRDELIEERARWIRILNKYRRGGYGIKSRPVTTHSILGERI
jgi:hypothetical protein